MDDFNYIEGTGKTVFQVLGDFEEDGDLWMCGLFNGELQRITGDSGLREQQPDIFKKDSGDLLIAYAGVKRLSLIHI